MIKHLVQHVIDVIGAALKEGILLIILVFALGGLIFFLPNLEITKFILKILKSTWWIWTFVFSFLLFESVWLFWRQQIFKEDIDWILLEILIPREHNRTPKAMEHVLKSLHSLGNAPADLQEKYWDGEVTRWFSLEMTSFSGEVHYYIRCYKKQRILIESAFFAQYPDLELVETDDYAENLPQDTREMYEEGRNIWGTELLLTKPAAYPIISYKDLIHENEEERQVDPMSYFMEVCSKAEENVFVGIQIVLSAASDSWRKDWEKLLKDLKDKTSSKKEITAEDQGEGVTIGMRTPGETQTLKEIEENLSQQAFDTTIRYIYIAPEEIYYDSFPRRGLRGAFKQYGSIGRNSFQDNAKTSTRTKIWYWPHIFPRLRAEMRKQRILKKYITRDTPEDNFMGKLLTSHPFNWNFASKPIQLSIESVASIFHPPTTVVVTAPHISERVDSRRAGPPAGLPIFGEEEKIEKYK